MPSIRPVRPGPVLRRRRDPANELFDRACDVVAAAAELREASSRDNNDAAVAATLGCLQSALEDVGIVLEQLRDTSVQRIAGAWPLPGRKASSDADSAIDRFAAAVEAIRAAGAACREVREAVGPMLAELTFV